MLMRRLLEFDTGDMGCPLMRLGARAESEHVL